MHYNNRFNIMSDYINILNDLQQQLNGAGSTSELKKVMNGFSKKYHPDKCKKRGICIEELQFLLREIDEAKRTPSINRDFNKLQRKVKSIINAKRAFKPTADTGPKPTADNAGSPGNAPTMSAIDTEQLKKIGLGTAVGIGTGVALYKTGKYMHKKSPKVRALVRKIRGQHRPMHSKIRSVKENISAFAKKNKKAIGLGAALATLGAIGYVTYKKKFNRNSKKPHNSLKKTQKKQKKK